MEEPHVEGVATHDDPESCAQDREALGEALTGARAGRVLSREIGSPEVSTWLLYTEDNMVWPAKRKGQDNLPRSKTPRTHGTSLHGNREISTLPDSMARRDEPGRP